MNLPEIATVPARDGYEWVRLALRLFRLQWLRYTSLTALFILILQFSGAITGGILSALIYPVLKVGFLAAAWHHERGEVPEISHLFAGFKSNLKALLPLGVVYLAGLVIAMMIGLKVAGIDLETVMAADAKAPIAKETLVQFMMVVIVCMLPINAMLWFAAALIVFADATFAQSLARSFQAWTRNILAMIVYGLTLFAMMFVIGLLAMPLMILAGAAAQTVVFMVALVPVTAIVMISDYVSYRRVFHRNERLQVMT
jgi:hypothetical protein